jgi:hypothetical protein
MSPYLPTSDNRRARSITFLVVAFAVAASLLLTGVPGGEASGLTRAATAAAPSHPLLGITGNAGRFETQTGQDSAVVHAFLGWDQGLSWGVPFAAFFPMLGPIPMLHLGTKGRDPRRETITPGEIAAGEGDAYLLALNRAIALWGKAIYLRPMAEMNNANSFYGAYDASGAARDAAHSTSSFKKAFARIYLILHGGSAKSIDAKLKSLGMAPLRGGVDLLVNKFPTLRIVWSPLASDNPRVAGNAAEQYYPGAGFVDVEGGDIYAEGLGDTAPWAGLEKLYDRARARGKPFSVPEWGLDGVDDVAFVRHMCTFLQTHKPTEVAIFYESKPGSAYDLEPKPSSRQAYRECVTPLAGAYPEWARANEPGRGSGLGTLILEPEPSSGGSPLKVEFSIEPKVGVPIVHWDILFGDGEAVAGNGPPPKTLAHTYKGAGVYHAVLFVFRAPPFTLEDAPFFTSADVSVGTGAPPRIDLIPTPAGGPVPLAVSFRTELDLPGAATAWTMVFGDGYSRHETGPPPRFSGHTFSAPGTFQVLLIVDTRGGKRYSAVVQITPGGSGGGTKTTTTAPTGAPAPPATGTPKGDVLLNGKEFEGGKVPYGSKVDVSDGSLELKTDTGKLNVYGEGGIPAKFKLQRSTDNGKKIVVLVLDGGDFSSCPKRKKSSAHVLAPKKPIRSLWGSGKGKFRTKGRYAAATVRGTIWLTVDRCDGTLIKVEKGVIEVLDVKLKKVKRIKAGRSYLAKR